MEKTIESVKGATPEMKEVIEQMEKLYKVCESNNVSLMLIAALPETKDAIVGVHGSENLIVQAATANCINYPAPARIIEKIFLNIMADRAEKMQAKHNPIHESKNNTRGN